MKFSFYRVQLKKKGKTNKQTNKQKKKDKKKKEKVKRSLASSPYSGTRLLQVSNCREQNRELETEINVVDIVFKHKLKFS